MQNNANDLRSMEIKRLQLKAQNEHDELTDALCALVSVVDLIERPVASNQSAVVLWHICCRIFQALHIKTTDIDEEALLQAQDPLDFIVDSVGVRSREVQLSDRWWKQDHGPLLAQMKEDNRWVGLIYETPWHGVGGCYHVLDMARHQTYGMTSDQALAISPMAWSFYSTFKNPTLQFKDLIAFSQVGNGSDWLRLLAMVCVGGLLSLAIPFGFGLLLSQFMEPSATNAPLYWLVTILLGSAIANMGSQLTRGLTLLRIQGLTDNVLQPALWNRLLALRLPFFRDYRVGDLGMRVMGINQIRVSLTGQNVVNLFGGLLIVFYLIFIACYSPIIALMTLGLVSMLWIFTWAVACKMLPYIRQEATLSGSSMGRMLQYIQGISKIRMTSTEKTAFSQWAKGYAQLQKNIYRSQYLLSMVNAVYQIFPVLAMACLFFMFVISFDTLPSAVMSAYFLAMNAAFGVVMSLAILLGQTLLQMLNVIPLYQRLEPILQSPTETYVKKNGPDHLEGHIEMHSVSFRYTESTPWILEDLTLSIRAREYVAVVGASGGGKSTFLRLLLGFEQPNSGNIYYDHQAFNKLDVTAVRRRMGVVLQNSQLMMDSIFNNVTAALPYTLDEAWAALQLVGLEDIVKKLPMGIHTFVGEDAGGLSGGEKQLLLLARALIGRPSILLLDEATSTLDNLSQARVTETLRHIPATRIVLAHRLSTVRHADCIVVFKNGRVAESGSYDELIDKGGEFTELARRQLV